MSAIARIARNARYWLAARIAGLPRIPPHTASREDALKFRTVQQACTAAEAFDVPVFSLEGYRDGWLVLIHPHYLLIPDESLRKIYLG